MRVRSRRTRGRAWASYDLERVDTPAHRNENPNFVIEVCQVGEPHRGAQIAAVDLERGAEQQQRDPFHWMTGASVVTPAPYQRSVPEAISVPTPVFTSMRMILPAPGPASTKP